MNDQQVSEYFWRFLQLLDGHDVGFLDVAYMVHTHCEKYIEENGAELLFTNPEKLHQYMALKAAVAEYMIDLAEEMEL